MDAVNFYRQWPQYQVIPANRNGVKKQLYLGALTNSSTTLYTAPSAPTIANSVAMEPVTVIESLWISNTDSSARTVTLYVVESGGSIGANRMVFPAKSVAATDLVEYKPMWVLPAGATLRGLASTTAVVTLIVSGTEYT